MEMYAEEGDIQRTMQTAIRVAAYQYADYTEMTVCFHLLRLLKSCHANCAYTVPHADRQGLLHSGTDPRAPKDFLHAHQHGLAGFNSQNHGQLSPIWEDIQG